MTAEEYFELTPIGKIYLWNKQRGFETTYTKEDVIHFAQAYHEGANKKPTRYKCMLCGRDKFTRKSPHNCRGGFRKRKIEWLPIYE